MFYFFIYLIRTVHRLTSQQLNVFWCICICEAFPKCNQTFPHGRACKVFHSMEKLYGIASWNSEEGNTYCNMGKCLHLVHSFAPSALTVC